MIIKQMIQFNSKEKDRNYHRSKNKLFNHAHIRASTQRPKPLQQANNVTINLHPRLKSPSKQSKRGRSPSKGSAKSKNSVFSDRDKLMTRQVAVNAQEYNMNGGGYERRREFRSPEEGGHRIERKERLSEESKGTRLLRPKQIQRQQHTRRKQRFPKLFQGAIQTPKHLPPRSPRHQFTQQKGQIQIKQSRQMNNSVSRQQEQLRGLQEENQFYKLVYKASLEKMKRLERSIEKEKGEYERTKEKFEKELRSLKYKMRRNDKKVMIGHIYSYDQKDTLNFQPQNIIPETDNEASEITRNNDIEGREQRGRKDQLPSRLSIDST